MNFDYNEEQQLLADSVRRFLAARTTTSRRAGRSSRRPRATARSGLGDVRRDGTARRCRSRPTYGGFGGGAVDLMGVMEAFGEALVVEPYLSTVAQARSSSRRAAPGASKQALLPAVAEGKMKMAFAHTEKRRALQPAHVATRAKANGRRLDASTARKRVVVGAPCADQLIVSARTSGGDADRDGISVFVVDAQDSGVSMNAYRTHRRAARGRRDADGVHVPAEALIGQEGQGIASDRGGRSTSPPRLLCAEAVGAMKYRLRHDARIPQDAQAVRRADRHVPGAAASHGRHGHRARTGAVDGVPRLRQGRLARPIRSSGSASSRRRRSRSPTACATSARNRCSCTAAWA